MLLRTVEIFPYAIYIYIYIVRLRTASAFGHNMFTAYEWKILDNNKMKSIVGTETEHESIVKIIIGISSYCYTDIRIERCFKTMYKTTTHK